MDLQQRRKAIPACLPLPAATPTSQLDFDRKVLLPNSKSVAVGPANPNFGTAPEAACGRALHTGRVCLKRGDVLNASDWLDLNKGR